MHSARNTKFCIKTVLLGFAVGEAIYYDVEHCNARELPNLIPPPLWEAITHFSMGRHLLFYFITLE